MTGQQRRQPPPPSYHDDHEALIHTLRANHQGLEHRVVGLERSLQTFMGEVREAIQRMRTTDWRVVVPSIGLLLTIGVLVFKPIDQRIVALEASRDAHLGLELERAYNRGRHDQVVDEAAALASTNRADVHLLQGAVEGLAHELDELATRFDEVLGQGRRYTLEDARADQAQARSDRDFILEALGLRLQRDDGSDPP